MAAVAQAQPELNQFKDWRWRVNNLYFIKTEAGEEVKFTPNWVQQALMDELHYLNLVLKARQLGITTLIQLLMLDACVFNDNISAATVAHRLPDAIEIFDNKVRFAYDRLPEQLRAIVPAELDSVRKLKFANGSTLLVDIMLRSGTFQYLHISEHGKLCAKYPEKAKELRSGALNTVHAGQMIFIESTAEGREGDFYEFTQRARALQDTARPLTRLDFKFFFYPWWQHPDYRLTPEETNVVPIPANLATYFEELSEKGIVLDDQQKAWYASKHETQQEDMFKEFPSTPEEAFAAAIEGSYYGRELARLRQKGQITKVPWAPQLPVDTFWDLGKDDETAIWFFQSFKNEKRLIDYYANRDEGFAHYAKLLKDKPYVYGRHYLPHDVEVEEMSTKRARKTTLISLGVRPIVTVPRAQDLADHIQMTRNWLSDCWFDEENCSEGLKALESYRKEWNDKLGTYHNHPRHDFASHGADAFRTGAVGWKPQIKAEPLRYDNRGIV